MAPALGRHRIGIALTLTLVSGCRGPATATVEIDRFEGTRPEYVRATCLTRGGEAPFTYQWRLGPQVGWLGLRSRGPVAMVQVADANKPGSFVECTATDAQGQHAVAVRRFQPMVVTGVSAPEPAAGAVFTVSGAGFGPTLGPGDGVYLLPSRSRGVRADHACPRARWLDTAIVACLPRGPAGKVRVRVQSGGRLATAPLVLELRAAGTR
jgi:hypothetical protein